MYPKTIHSTKPGVSRTLEVNDNATYSVIENPQKDYQHSVFFLRNNLTSMTLSQSSFLAGYIVESSRKIGWFWKLSEFMQDLLNRWKIFLRISLQTSVLFLKKLYVTFPTYSCYQ